MHGAKTTNYHDQLLNAAPKSMDIRRDALLESFELGNDVRCL